MRCKRNMTLRSVHLIFSIWSIFKPYSYNIIRIIQLRTGCWVYLGSRGMKYYVAGEHCIMRSFTTCTLIIMIKSRRMRWERHVARMREEKYVQRFSRKTWRKGRPRRRWEHKIIMDLREIGRGYGLDSFGSGQRTMAGFCRHGNEPSSFTKFWQFLQWLFNHWLLKKDSAPCS
jgi:hypothetical protein